LSPEQKGMAIQAYVRSKRRRAAPAGQAPDPGDGLDRETRQRIDALGLDDERLLEVAASEVMHRLAAIEAAAVSEDIRAARIAARMSPDDDLAGGAGQAARERTGRRRGGSSFNRSGQRRTRPVPVR